MGYGDELMVSGRARVMQQSDPRKVRPTFQGKPKWNAVWDNNPRFARLEERGDFQELIARDMANNRPYHISKTPERWGFNLDFRPDVGEIYFTDREREFGAVHPGRIIIEPNPGPGTSPNKQWPLHYWDRLIRMAKTAGIEFTQLGGHGNRILPGANYIRTDTFRQACAVLANSRAYVGHEGGMHHASAAVGLPGVVIFGGYTPIELTGYSIHRNLGVSLGEACGMRIQCEHCAKAMAAITPEQVFNELEVILEQR